VLRRVMFLGQIWIDSLVCGSGVLNCISLNCIAAIASVGKWVCPNEQREQSNSIDTSGH
jgi:hypothetical protein